LPSHRLITDVLLMKSRTAPSVSMKKVYTSEYSGFTKPDHRAL